ncbi:hypothetical protein jhhlp_008766 [Lomentospora prolificans]|uniref:Tat pathway signal sequence n=1 Tax=Lomentospora prolificans TaxID=41688 RepID=A0A2N3MYY5_9PEZI|nr:hypothetical protein jhhlp_008766 [Lomentospora prolificans]
MRKPRWQRFPVTAPVLIPVLIVLNILLSGVVIVLANKKPTDYDCASQLSTYSPVLEAGVVQYVEFDFNDGFNSTSNYRGPPTRATEEAWFKLVTKPGIKIPKDKLSSLNRSVNDHLVEYVDINGSSAGTGQGYIAGIEVFHQLHCLNIVRQYTWFLLGEYKDIDPPALFQLGDDESQEHIDHCIESIRLSLMCSADVTPILLVNDPSVGFHQKQNEFGTHHKCRNFDEIEKWVDGSQRFLGT